MIIPILKNDAAYVRRVDAESRVAIWLVNHINSHEISKLGLTHIPGGAIDATGLIKLYTSYPGLIANTTHYVQGFCPAVPQLNPLIAVTRDYLITPNATLQMATGNGLLLDCVYAAKKLNLFNKNMDALSGPNLIRVLRYPLYFPIGFNMHCYDVDGSFKGVYILVNDSVFELKCFKYYYSIIMCFFSRNRMI